MDLRNCPRCGKPYIHMGPSRCPSCLQEEEAAFMTVHSYLREHPGETPEAVSAATGVEVPIILRMLREGRLQGLAAGLHCERCGVPIEIGRFCESCVHFFERALQAGNPASHRAVGTTDTHPGTAYHSQKPPEEHKRVNESNGPIDRA